MDFEVCKCGMKVVSVIAIFEPAGMALEVVGAEFGGAIEDPKGTIHKMLTIQALG